VTGSTRRATVSRSTKETSIDIDLDLDGSGAVAVTTGLPFFDHMVGQLGKHGGFDLTVKAEGDLDVDEGELVALLEEHEHAARKLEAGASRGRRHRRALAFVFGLALFDSESLEHPASSTAVTSRAMNGVLRRTRCI